MAVYWVCTAIFLGIRLVDVCFLFSNCKELKARMSSVLVCQTDLTLTLCLQIVISVDVGGFFQILESYTRWILYLCVYLIHSVAVAIVLYYISRSHYCYVSKEAGFPRWLVLVYIVCASAVIVAAVSGVFAAIVTDELKYLAITYACLSLEFGLYGLFYSYFIFSSRIMLLDSLNLFSPNSNVEKSISKLEISDVVKAVSTESLVVAKNSIFSEVVSNMEKTKDLGIQENLSTFDVLSQSSSSNSASHSRGSSVQSSSLLQSHSRNLSNLSSIELYFGNDRLGLAPCSFASPSVDKSAILGLSPDFSSPCSIKSPNESSFVSSNKFNNLINCGKTASIVRHDNLGTIEMADSNNIDCTSAAFPTAIIMHPSPSCSENFIDHFATAEILACTSENVEDSSKGVNRDVHKYVNPNLSLSTNICESPGIFDRSRSPFSTISTKKRSSSDLKSKPKLSFINGLSIQRYQRDHALVSQLLFMGIFTFLFMICGVILFLYRAATTFSGGSLMDHLNCDPKSYNFFQNSGYWFQFVISLLVFRAGRMKSFLKVESSISLEILSSPT